MVKISLDTEQQEIQITRSIGKSGDGKITVNREGGAIGINLGIASIGATTDYGGAISLGIAGQEVTWGREGGTIHIGVGGFTVDVEARDCIVTEIKAIFGQIVAQRSYPDPGCELPPPVPTPGTPSPSPEPGGEGGIDLPSGNEVGWVICHMLDHTYAWGRANQLYYKNTTTRSVSDIEKKNRSADRLPFKLVSKNNPYPYNADYTYEKGTPVHYFNTYHTDGVAGRGRAMSAQMYPPNTYPFWYDAGFFGPVGEIKKFINLVKANNQADIAAQIKAGARAGVKTYYYFIATQFIPLQPGEQKPPLPTGNKPPMQPSCCEEILEILEELKEALAVDRILKEKFPVSNTFMAPECDPTSVTEATNYYEILQCAFRTMAHGLIFEPRVKIKDADAAKAGDQEFKARYLNATGWASAVSEALMEVKDDGNVGTNMDIRALLN